MNKLFHILIVDDMQSEIMFLEHILSSGPYKTHSATDGNQALIALKANPIDLIILDVVMPGEDGFSVCKKLKALQSTRDIPVIFLTGKTEDESIVTGLQFGAADFIKKPFNKEELLLRIKTCLDIKEKEHSLEKEKKRLEIALFASKLGLWELEIESGKMHWDEHTYSLYGFNPDEFSPSFGCTDEMMVKEDFEKENPRFEKVLSSKAHYWETRFRINRPDKGLRWIEEKAYIQRDSSGKALRMIGTIMDITSQIEAEENLIESGLQKDKFVSILAHDLKNLIGNSIQFVELLKDHYHISTGNSKTDEFLGYLFDNINNTYLVLEDILLWGRTSLGHLPCKPEKHIINNIVSHICESLTPLAVQKNITLSVDIKKPYPALVDEKMMQIVIRNLIINAIKYSNNGGKIIVKVQMFDSEYLVVKVIDNGVGFGDDIKERLFKIDKANSQEGTNKEQGTGLGLLICHEMVRKHKGTIWADSEEEKGSTFSFTIPMA